MYLRGFKKYLHSWKENADQESDFIIFPELAKGSDFVLHQKKKLNIVLDKDFPLKKALKNSGGLLHSLH